MEDSKKVRNKIIIIITLVVFAIAIIFMYSSPVNIGFKAGYDIPATELF